MAHVGLVLAAAAGLTAATFGATHIATRDSSAERAHLIGQRAPLKRLYAPSSPFNRPIGRHPRLDPDSRRLVAGLAEAVDRHGFVIAVRRWTVPVYVAGPRTRRYRVALTAEWAPARVLTRVPIPRAARPDPAADGHLAILDRASGCEYDLWQARRHAGGWSASWANGVRARGRGVYPHGLSARGSGFALLAGVIRPDELARGRIDHALIFSYPYTSAAGFVAPATESDGRSDRPDALPEGARLQLDPGFDVGSLPRYQRIVARALQRYGMYLADTSANLSVYAVNPQSYAGNPYADVLPGDAYPDLGDIPVRRLRVLAHGPLKPPVGVELAPSRCARFR